MFYFAMVQPTETVWGVEHKRHDAIVHSLKIAQTEGNFASLTIRLKNPRTPYLQPGEPIWCWLAKNDTPLFFGRRIALPQNLTQNIVELSFIARPDDYETLKEALAETLRVYPYWDEVWINADRASDPDVVLEARSALFHTDRVTHAVTISDIINGEDGVVNMTNLFYDSLNMTFGTAPLTRVRVEAEVSWPQMAQGRMDVNLQLKDAFKVAGSSDGRISSYTGQGLQADWLKVGDNLDGGWKVAVDTLTRRDATAWDQTTLDVRIQPVADGNMNKVQAAIIPAYTAEFALWEFVADLQLDYAANRQKIETLTFDLKADMQEIHTSTGKEEVVTFAVQSKRVIEPIDPPTAEHPDGAMPIGELKARSYFHQERGRQSAVYLMAVARAKLLSRARACQVQAAYTFDFGTQFTLRKNVVITDPRLPGGQATGKIVGYTLVAEGDGRQYSTVTLACAVGRGNIVVAAEGDADYGEDDWDEDYQFRVGEWIMPVVDEVAYLDYSDTPIVDDGVDFDQIDPTMLVTKMEVINGQSAQESAMSGDFVEPAHAIESMNAVHTEVWMELEPLTGTPPFITPFAIQTTDLMVPRLVDVEGVL